MQRIEDRLFLTLKMILMILFIKNISRHGIFRMALTVNGKKLRVAVWNWSPIINFEIFRILKNDQQRPHAFVVTS